MTASKCPMCDSALEHIDVEEQMECTLCHKTEGSWDRCPNGHFVCTECHSKGLDQMFTICMEHASKNPFDVLADLMSMDSCKMNGPEHHIFVSAALLTAYKNAGGDVDLEAALSESVTRGGKVPAAVCGLWGSCGAAIATGQFVSIATKSTPLSEEPWGQCNKMTSLSLGSLAEIGGPRCCKRNCWLSMFEAVKFAKEQLGVEMEAPERIVCDRMEDNKQCIGERCPFHPDCKA